MATITTRVQGASPKGSPLTNAEVDNNFINLNSDKVEKSGDTLTGSLKTTDNTTFAPIFVDGGNVDAHVLRISSDASSYSGAHGFSLKYMGSRNGLDNSLSIFADNENATTQVEAIRIQQDGEVRFSEAPTVGGTAVTLVGHTHTIDDLRLGERIGGIYTDISATDDEFYIPTTDDINDAITWNIGKIQDERIIGVQVTVYHSDLENGAYLAIGTSAATATTHDDTFGGPDNMVGWSTHYFPVSAVSETSDNYLYIWGSPADGGYVYAVVVHAVEKLDTADQFFNSLTVPTFKGNARAQGVWNFEDGIKIGGDDAGGDSRITFYEGSDPTDGDAFRIFYDGLNYDGLTNRLVIWSNSGNTGWKGNIAVFQAGGDTEFTGPVTFSSTSDHTFKGNVVIDRGTVNDANLTLRADTDNAGSEADHPSVRFKQDADQVDYRIGIGKNDADDVTATANTLFITGVAGDTGMGLMWSPDNGTSAYNIWREDNDGPDSGLNADMLDGVHASGFALGANPATELSNIDSTDIATGFYDVSTSATGSPRSGVSHTLLNIPGGAANAITQMAWMSNNFDYDQLYVRHYDADDTTWTSWKEIMHTGIMDFATGTSGYLHLPSGTTAQRPSSPSAGWTRYNTTLSSIEFYNGTSWVGTNINPTVNSVTGTLYNTAPATITLTTTNATTSASVIFTSSSTVVATVACTVSNDSTTISVPSAVRNLAAGTSVGIRLQNEDGADSNAFTKTVQAIPSGGTRTVNGNYVVHRFTSSGTFVVPSGFSASVSYIVVAGGGGGGAGNSASALGGGGGGGGGYVSGSTTVSAGNYTITIGAGGAGDATITSTGTTGNAGDGGNSSGFGATAIGGGGGGSRNATETGNSGGSGGGACGNASASGGSGTTGQGNAGGSKLGSTNSWSACGGGGYGAAGANAGASGTTDDTNTGGGAGITVSWLSSGVVVSGGGGGGGNNGESPSTAVASAGGTGNSSGGDGGTKNVDTTGGDAPANAGGGGGGSACLSGNSVQPTRGGNGGGGTVFVRYSLV